MPRRRRSSGCWSGAPCVCTPPTPAHPAPAQPWTPPSRPAYDAQKPCTGAGKAWLAPGGLRSACMPCASEGSADAPPDSLQSTALVAVDARDELCRPLQKSAPANGALFCRRHSSSSCASTATHVALSALPALALRPPPRDACACAQGLGSLGGCGRVPAQQALPQTPGKCAGGAGTASAAASAQQGQRAIRNGVRCTGSPPLQRLLDMDRHELLALVQGYEALMAVTTPRGASPPASCPDREGRLSTPVRSTAGTHGGSSITIRLLPLVRVWKAHTMPPPHADELLAMQRPGR